MSKIIEKAEPYTLPLIAMRGIVAFPGIPLNFEIADQESIAAAKAGSNTGSFVFLASLTSFGDPTEAPDYNNLCNVGVVAKIRQLITTPDKNYRIIVEGVSRATIIKRHELSAYSVVDVLSKVIHLEDDDNLQLKAYRREILKTLDRFVDALPSATKDIITATKGIKNLALMADFIASNFLIHPEDKQHILEAFDPIKRMEALLEVMQEECELMECESEIHNRVQKSLNRTQKEYYLREEIKTIQEELGDGLQNDVDMYFQKIQNAHLPDEVREKLRKETEKLARCAMGSPEALVLSNYLDTCLELPFNQRTNDRLDIKIASKILEEDHDGLDKIKERIIEYLAVKQLNPNLKNQILCLVGPPGTGKTSIASSIARAMKRRFVRVSLGGVRDEADIRGHRKTYIGAMPGRIITALTQAKSCNPIILLDEIDKLTRDAHGDPSSALLEVLDSEQNKAFRDHFIEMPFDLSECMFIATANTTDTIPKPLLDRMEIIELSTYTKSEKTAIATHHLIGKQLHRHGLTKRQVHITEGAISEIIDYYTREAGVRNLERQIADLCRKAARQIVEGQKKRITIDENDVSAYLGPRKLLPESIPATDEVGVVNGLAYTEVGGSLLAVETLIMDGTGKIELTGSLGNVMKESCEIAVSVVRSLANEYHIAPDFYKTKDIHIHFPEGAIPKDGPSAGVTIVTSLVSALSGIPVHHTVAMTGEISLRGKVLAIGGLKEKTMAAYSAGAKIVLIPKDNEADLHEIDALAKEGLTFIPCSNIKEVLQEALCQSVYAGTSSYENSDTEQLPYLCTSAQNSQQPRNTL